MFIDYYTNGGSNLKYHKQGDSLRDHSNQNRDENDRRIMKALFPQSVYMLVEL